MTQAGQIISHWTINVRHFAVIQALTDVGGRDCFVRYDRVSEQSRQLCFFQHASV